MNRADRSVLVLALLAVALLFGASLAAVLLDDGGNPHEFISLRGEEVQIYGGAGLYQFDNAYKAVIFRSFDWVNLVIVLPLFALAIFLYWRGQLRGRLLLTAMFTYLAYIYLIGVMGNAYNSSFLVWTALFSVGLFGLILTLADIDAAALPGKLESGFPRKSVSVFVIVVGLILLLQYLSEIITASASGLPPASLDHYTTLELAALELGIMIPLHIFGGVSLWRGKAWGYIISIPLAFTSAMVFLALSVSLLLFYLLFGRVNFLDMGITIVIALVATGFSIVIFKHV